MTNELTLPFTSFGEDFVLIPRVTAYPNGRLALEFWTEQEWGMEPFAKVTTNLPDQHLNDGEVFVKDWSENAELVAYLVEQGWLISTGREVVSGHVAPGVYRIAGPLTEFIAQEGN